jgi:hypothetical protein
LAAASTGCDFFNLFSYLIGLTSVPLSMSVNWYQQMGSTDLLSVHVWFLFSKKWKIVENLKWWYLEKLSFKFVILCYSLVAPECIQNSNDPLIHMNKLGPHVYPVIHTMDNLQFFF